MDVVWKVGNGSRVDDWELRMSMRSFVKNYHASANFWIIGHIPKWVDIEQVNCVACPNPYSHCKDANLIHKALRMAMEPRLSDPFLFCSDDQLLNKSMEPEQFKLWHLGEIAPEPNKKMNKWEKRVVNTGQRLREAGFSAFHFEGHIPYKLYKGWIREALRFDFVTSPGMCVHTTILNCSPEIGERADSRSLRAWLGKKDISEREIENSLTKCHFIGINNEALRNGHVVRRLQELFPEPAPWELLAAKDGILPMRETSAFIDKKELCDVA